MKKEDTKEHEQAVEGERMAIHLIKAQLRVRELCQMVFARNWKGVFDAMFEMRFEMLMEVGISTTCAAGQNLCWF